MYPLKQMVHILIRHYDKTYSNGGNTEYALDPPLLPDPNGRLPLFQSKLVALYGSPKAIFVSPYERTRQTALRLAPEAVPITVHPLLSEHVSSKHEYQYEEPLRGITASYSPPLYEGQHAFRARMKDWGDLLEALEDDGAVYWWVTHGLNIKTLLSTKGYDIYPKPLTAVALTDPLQIIKG